MWRRVGRGGVFVFVCLGWRLRGDDVKSGWIPGRQKCLRAFHSGYSRLVDLDRLYE